MELLGWLSIILIIGFILKRQKPRNKFKTPDGSYPNATMTVLDRLARRRIQREEDLWN